jgi:hypothetical protein
LGGPHGAFARQRRIGICFEEVAGVFRIRIERVQHGIAAQDRAVGEAKIMV